MSWKGGEGVFGAEMMGRAWYGKAVAALGWSCPIPENTTPGADLEIRDQPLPDRLKHHGPLGHCHTGIQNSIGNLRAIKRPRPDEWHQIPVADGFHSKKARRSNNRRAKPASGNFC
jgi:hypothetical protein